MKTRPVAMPSDPSKSASIVLGLTKGKTRPAVVKAGSLETLETRFGLSTKLAKKMLGLK